MDNDALSQLKHRYAMLGSLGGPDIDAAKAVAADAIQLLESRTPPPGAAVERAGKAVVWRTPSDHRPGKHETTDDERVAASWRADSRVAEPLYLASPAPAQGYARPLGMADGFPWWADSQRPQIVGEVRAIARRAYDEGFKEGRRVERLSPAPEEGYVRVPREPSQAVIEAMAECYDPTWAYPDRSVANKWAAESYSEVIAAAEGKV